MLAALRCAGIRVPKVQVTAGLRVAVRRGCDATLDALGAFADDVYLHQVVERRADGTLVRHLDLPQALAAARRREGDARVARALPRPGVSRAIRPVRGDSGVRRRTAPPGAGGAASPSTSRWRRTRGTCCPRSSGGRGSSGGFAGGGVGGEELRSSWRDGERSWDRRRGNGLGMQSFPRPSHQRRAHARSPPLGPLHSPSRLRRLVQPSAGPRLPRASSCLPRASGGDRGRDPGRARRACASRRCWRAARGSPSAGRTSRSRGRRSCLRPACRRTSARCRRAPG